MVNEIVQWAVLCLLTLAVLGLFRQIAFTLPPDRRSTPEGPPVGRRAPAPLREGLEAAGVRRDLISGLTVAFVSEACVGCQRLLADLPSEIRDTGIAIALVAHKPSLAFAQALNEIEVPVVFDDGAIWEACQVTATPLLIHLDRDGRVANKEVTHDVRSVTRART